VVITEFGWPGGPDGYCEVNDFTHQNCTGIASEQNQNYVIEKSLELFKKTRTPAIVFDAFRETWKTEEGEMAAYWGICNNTAPYNCKRLFGYDGVIKPIPSTSDNTTVIPEELGIPSEIPLPSPTASNSTKKAGLLPSRPPQDSKTKLQYVSSASRSSTVLALFATQVIWMTLKLLS
jgi:hypothetical protein